MECKILNPTNSLFHQYEVLNLSDSYNDISMHGVRLSIFGHLVEWALKFFFILSLRMRVADHKSIKGLVTMVRDING